MSTITLKRSSADMVVDHSRNRDAGTVVLCILASFYDI